MHDNAGLTLVRATSRPAIRTHSSLGVVPSSGLMAMFRRRNSAPGSQVVVSNTDGEWSLGKGEVNGKPLIARWDNAAKRSCPDRSRPVKVTIGIQCANTRPD